MTEHQSTLVIDSQFGQRKNFKSLNQGCSFEAGPRTDWQATTPARSFLIDFRFLMLSLIECRDLFFA